MAYITVITRMMYIMHMLHAKLSIHISRMDCATPLPHLMHQIPSIEIPYLKPIMPVLPTKPMLHVKHMMYAE